MRHHPCFSGTPDFGKVAIGGRWEQAVVFAPGATLEIHGDEVACEAFFGKAFFGMRRRGPDPSRFVANFSQAMASGRFFDALKLPDGRFAFAELGAEGAWLSVEPVRVDPWSAVRDFEGFWRGLQGTPVALDDRHDKALEFAFEGDYWFALPVSVDRLLDPGLLRGGLEYFSAA